MKRYGKNSAMHNRRNLVTVYLDDKEAELLQKISKQTDMSNDAILRQSFRMYQMIRFKMDQQEVSSLNALKLDDAEFCKFMGHDFNF